ncbi:hypothetical protein F751_6228 [Auxenochlorella protothecoides]|uniref:Uncharacterized protein n=1 Tax=Auxenochlorella protothecoides TaxID=3075 RepID=A0A087SK23_AUXPR|nr:hypothetical protein F751_6228 [Auxenochlorella protothecoides]KFM26077.1 hypothetical protein F751_6228 [Auxenochlorella protothecoides]
MVNSSFCRVSGELFPARHALRSARPRRVGFRPVHVQPCACDMHPAEKHAL